MADFLQVGLTDEELLQVTGGADPTSSFYGGGVIGSYGSYGGPNGLVGGNSTSVYSNGNASGPHGAFSFGNASGVGLGGVIVGPAGTGAGFGGGSINSFGGGWGY